MLCYEIMLIYFWSGIIYPLSYIENSAKDTIGPGLGLAYATPSPKGDSRPPTWNPVE